MVYAPRDMSSTVTTTAPASELILRADMSLGARNRWALADIAGGAKLWRLAWTLGWLDIRLRYRGSMLGPFWLTISTGVMVAALGILYSTLFKINLRDYLPFLAVGLVIWGYLSSVVNEGCVAFIGSAYLIKQIRLPLTIHVCRIVWRNFVILLHSLPVVIVLLFVFGHWPRPEFLLVPFGLLLLLLHGVWIGVALGVLCARFRDIPPIVTNLIQVVFFFTPVMWSPEVLKGRGWVAEYNPLYHIIETIRAPLTGRPVRWESWAWSIGVAIVGFVFAQYLLRRARNRIPYWL